MYESYYNVTFDNKLIDDSYKNQISDYTVACESDIKASGRIKYMWINFKRVENLTVK